MDGPQTPTPPPSDSPLEPQRLGWPDFRLVALLILLTLGLRAFQLAATEVTARDSISYIHIAWRLEHNDWRQVLPTASQHPGYPIAVLAASLPVRLFFPNDLPYAMQVAAQLASAAASVLLVAPLFWLGRQLFNRRIAFWAVLLFQCLPCSGRIMADGLSEAVFLLFAVTALAAAMYALRSGSVLAFAAAGAAGGLAYLTRPEGLLIPAVVGLTLLGMQFSARWRRPWRSVLANGAVLTAAVLTVGGPYMIVIHGLTVKNSVHHMINDAAPAEARAADGVAGGPAPLAVWWTGDGDDVAGRSEWAVWTVVKVLYKAFFYVLWFPALLGLLCFPGRFRTVPGAWMLVLLCVILTALLYGIAARMGYLSDRHTILILVCGVLWAAAALDGAGRGLAWLAAYFQPDLAGKWWTNGALWATCLLLTAAIAPLARTLEPLHGDRVGFQAAGYWLREHAGSEETVFDPFGWSSYYDGRYFRPEAALYFRQETFPEGPWNYVVLEEGSNKHSHLTLVSRAEELARSRGTEICRFPAPRGKETAAVVIYAVQNGLPPSGGVAARPGEQ